MHECKHEQDFKEITKSTNAIFTDTQLIKQAILGNGQPGLCQRMTKVEAETQTLREYKIKIDAKVGAYVAIISSVCGVLSALLVKLF